MNLIADIGNTALKLALSQGTVIGKTFRHRGDNHIDFICEIAAVYHPEKIIICSVKCLSLSDISKLSSINERVVILDPTHNDITRSEGVSDKFSPDYCASILAASRIFPGKNFTIFDFGTCLNVVSYNKNSTDIKTIPHEFCNRFSIDIVKNITSEIDMYISDNPSSVVIFTGGDANYFAKRTKNCIFVVSNLVLMGLALIAEKYE